MERRKKNVEGHIGRNKTVNNWIADGSSATINFFCVRAARFFFGRLNAKKFF